LVLKMRISEANEQSAQRSVRTQKQAPPAQNKAIAL